MFLNNTISFLLVLTTLIASGCCSIFPKMLSETALEGKSFLDNHDFNDGEELISSRSFVTFGKCYHNQSLHVPISGGSGRGVIATISNPISIAKLAYIGSELSTTSSSSTSNSSSTITLDDTIPGNFFDMIHPDSNHQANTTGQDQTFPFRFQNVNDDGATVEIICSQVEPANIVVIVRDDSNVVVKARAKFDSAGSQRIELDGDTNSEVTLRGTSRKGKTSNQKAAKFKKASKKGITIEHEKPGGVAVIQMNIRSPKGKLIHRSIVARTRKPPPPVKAMGLVESQIDDDNGDVLFKFGNIQSVSRPLKVDARIGILVDHSKQHKSCVDITAIVDDQTLVVHNEWLRKCLNESGLSNQTDGWDVVVLNGTVTDPDDGYRVLAYLGQVVETGIRNHHHSKRRQLAHPPSSNTISLEMREGRKPQQQQQNLRRNHRSLGEQQQATTSRKKRALQQRPHRKLLVHGYCASRSPFPTNKFTNYAEFYDSSTPGSWSHDTFARKIATFSANLGGCGCIGHSQGGAACLHLKTYYHSCLDSPSVKGRAIQSVGTPYQGTPLAGAVAALGQVFGSSCGYNRDMTYSGSQRWLSGIPSWARSQVYYYTTSYGGFPYVCNFGASFLLNNPNDGVTEVGSDQLTGGNSMGNTRGWCHVSRMRFPAQTKDANRNAVMNAAAQY